MDGRCTCLQPHTISAALPHDLRFLQLQFANGRHHNPIARCLHLFQGTAHFFISLFGLGKIQNTGHQAGFVAHLQTGGFAQDFGTKDISVKLLKKQNENCKVDTLQGINH